MAEPHPNADATTPNPLQTLSETGDPADLADHPDVPLKVETVEVNEEQFDRFEETRGLAIAGITTDEDELLLVTRTDDEPDWTLPYGPAEADDEWAATAVDWVDGLTGVSATLEDVVLVRRHDITLDHGEASPRQTTQYHVVFGGHPDPGESIQADARYDCSDDWTAAWHDAVPTVDCDQRTGDIERFLD